jgi:hypothetical protein
VEQWAELRREHLVAGKSIQRVARSPGCRQHDPAGAAQRLTPSYQREPRPSVLEPFKVEIHRLLKGDPKMPGVRVPELLGPLGLTRPQVGRRRLPAKCGHCSRRRRRLVVSKETEDLLAGIAGCLERLGGLPQTLVWDRQAGVHAMAAPSERSPRSAASSRRAGCSASRPTRRPRASSSGCRATRRPTSSPAGGSPTSWTSKTSSTPGSRGSTRARTRRCAPGRSIASATTASDGAAARPDARQRAALDDARPARIRTCAWTPTTTASTRGSSAPRRGHRRPTHRHGRLPGHWRAGRRHARTFARHRTITALEHTRA